MLKVDTYPASLRPATVDTREAVDKKPMAIIPLYVETKLAVETYQAWPSPTTVETRDAVETKFAVVETTFASVIKLTPMMELTFKTCVLTKKPALIVEAFTINVLMESARMSGKSINPSPVLKVIVLTVILHMVAFVAVNELKIALLAVKSVAMEVEKLEKEEI